MIGVPWARAQLDQGEVARSEEVSEVWSSTSIRPFCKIIDRGSAFHRKHEGARSHIGVNFAGHRERRTCVGVHSW